MEAMEPILSARMEDWPVIKDTLFMPFFLCAFFGPKTLFFRVRVLCQNNPFFGSVFLPKILGREGGGKNFGMRSYSEVA